MKSSARRSGAQPDQSGYEWIDIKETVVPKYNDDLDEDVVAEIAGSILQHGLFHPIAVQRTLNRTGGEVNGQLVVVAGVHRRAAMMLLGKTSIPCFFVKGDDVDVQMIRLSEDLWRKNISVLRKSEMLVEYFRLGTAKVNNSGQPVQKSTPGRPQGGLSLAARNLPLAGRTDEARRKMLSRASKISQITLEAKEAAIVGGLANNQNALLTIATAKGHEDQLRAVAKLVEAYQGSQAQSASTKIDPDTDTTISSEQAGNDDASGQSEPRGDVSKSRSVSDGREINETTLSQMEALWRPECKACWSHLPARDRERFIDKLRRAKKAAKGDVVEFIRDAFRGRKEILKPELFALANLEGFGKQNARDALKALQVSSKQVGKGMGKKHYFLNPNRDWKEELPAISNRRFEEAVENCDNPRSSVKRSRASSPTDDDYFNDL